MLKGNMKVLSLFDGMSVAQQALKELGIPVEVYYASEIDPYAIAVTQSNFPETVQLGGVQNILTGDWTEESLDNIDLLIGGSPCQDLSIAKKNREGLKGSRSGLFWEYVRIRDEVLPKYFILENVASMPKEAKEVISEALGVQPVMINASLVSAQNRKRLFWVGKLNGNKYEQVEITQPEDRGILLKDVLESDVDEKYFLQTELSANGGGRGAKTGLYHIPHGYKKEEIKEHDKYPTLAAQDPRTKHLLHPEIRKLTPTECLRLQSMPDNYFDKATYKNKPISNTQRYKMCGNAFNCEVVKHIMKSMLLSK